MDGPVLIIGAEGMLGRELAEAFHTREPILWDKGNIDIADNNDVLRKLAAVWPSVVVNAAAFTDVDRCESQKELAVAVNGYAVGHLAAMAREVGALLVHYSTDYVFDGMNADGYAEGDEPKSPGTVYGESKLLGERLLREEGDKGLKYFLIRTSWLFGSRGKNFVRTIVELAKTNEELRIVNDQHGKPTFAKDLAAATLALIGDSHEPGIYHVVNEPETTWYDFATAICEMYALRDKDFKKPRIIPCTSVEFPRPAKRPNHSALINSKFPPLRPWKDALAEYFSEIILSK